MLGKTREVSFLSHLAIIPRQLYSRNSLAIIICFNVNANLDLWLSMFFKTSNELSFFKKKKKKKRSTYNNVTGSFKELLSGL